MHLQIWLTISALMFSIGTYGVLTRRNVIGVLLGLEIMANAVNLNLVVFAHYTAGAVGQVFALFAIALTVTEVAVGLAIVVLLHRTHQSILADAASEMSG